MLQKSNTQKIMQLFFTNPTKNYYLTQISKIINLSHTSVKPILDQLIKQKYLTKFTEIRGSREFPYYKANLTKKFKIEKSLTNLSNLIHSGLIQFLEEKLFPKNIILFGSYQRGEDTEDSDIDIFLENEPQHLNLTLFETKLNCKIQLHFNPNFNSYPNELKNNIINGIVLYGFLENAYTNNSGSSKSQISKKNGKNNFRKT